VSSRKRWRLDFDEATHPDRPTYWVHVNEENFDAAPGDQKVVHLVDNKRFDRVTLYYNKWSSRYFTKSGSRTATLPR
jgi:hypothetical protein